MPLYLKTSTATNSWRKAVGVYLKTSTATNSWRKVVSAFIKTTSGWQLIFGTAGPQIDSPLEISSNSLFYPATLTGTNYHWNSGTTFTSKFEKGSSLSGPWSNATSFETILNPSFGSSNTKTLILLESHFILNQASTFFRFVVRAQDSVSGKETTENSAPIEITVPDAVMSHTGGPIVATSTSISIPFTSNFALKYYIVEAYGPSGLVSSTRVDTPSSPVLVQGLSPNTTYDIVIYPYNFVDMVGTALLGIGITTLAGVPGPVTNLSRSTGNAGSKTFSWSAATTGGTATSYEYQLNNLGWFSNGSSTSINLTGLSGTNTFQVRAVNAAGSGTSTSTGSFVIPIINSGPTAGSITSSSATISWTSTNQSSYSLSVPGASGTPFTGTTGTSTSISLSSSTSYTPTLTITSSTGDTATVTGSSFTTLAPPPSPPTITSSSSTTTSITLNFNIGANSTSTRAYINGGFDGSTTGTSYTFFGLAPGTSYTLALYGYNGTTLSTTSSGGTYSTQTGPALTPTFGTNSSITGGFFGSVTNYDGSYTWGISTSAGSVSWSSPSGSTRAFTVTGLSSGQSATVTVTTSRSGYANGSASTTGSASVIQYTVTWNANGGTGGGTTTQNAGVAHTAPSPGTRSGFTFNAYYNTPSGDFTYGPIASGGSFTPPSSITMYARWTAIIPNISSITVTGNVTAGVTCSAVMTNTFSVEYVLYGRDTTTSAWIQLASGTASANGTSLTSSIATTSSVGTLPDQYYVTMTPYTGTRSTSGTGGGTGNAGTQRSTIGSPKSNAAGSITVNY